MQEHQNRPDIQAKGCPEVNEPQVRGAIEQVPQPSNVGAEWCSDAVRRMV